MKEGLLHASIAHQRYAPKSYRFFTTGTYFIVDPLSPPHFWETFPYLYRRRDHAALLQHQEVRESLNKIISRAKQGDESIEKVLLCTQLSLLGYNFNPISFFLFYKNNEVYKVLLEVSNTFREQKPYELINCGAGRFSLDTQKDFYISPFIRPDGRLKILLHIGEETLKAEVNSFEEDKLILRATLKAERLENSVLSRFFTLFKHPFGPLRSMFLIHLHALRLYLKKIPFHRKSESQHKQKGLLYVSK